METSFQRYKMSTTAVRSFCCRFQPLTFPFCLSEPRNAEQPGVGVRAHRHASSSSVLLRRPDRALLSAPGAAAAAQPNRSRSHSQQQQYPGPRPELRHHPGQRRGPADGHNPGGHQRLSPGRGGPGRRLPNRRSLLVGYEILLRGSDRSDTAAQGAAAPQEAGMHWHKRDRVLRETQMFRCIWAVTLICYQTEWKKIYLERKVEQWNCVRCSPDCFTAIHDVLC